MSSSWALLLVLVATVGCALGWAPGALGPSRRSVVVFGGKKAFTKSGPQPPRSPRPTQLFDNPEKMARITQSLKRGWGQGSDPEYDEEIGMAKRKLLELRMRKSQRLPFKPHEFRALRKEVARLQTSKRADELRAQGVDLRKKKPKTRRERKVFMDKKFALERKRAINRRRLGLKPVPSVNDERLGLGTPEALEEALLKETAR